MKKEKTIKKIISLSEIKNIIDVHKAKSHKVVFTNGCFDILHTGHVTYLEETADTGDILVVGLNSDLSIKKIKGDKRPIIEEMQRAKVVAALGFIDYVVLFDEPDPENLIKKIVPDVLVKGADWSEKNIIGADFVIKQGGKVIRIDLIPDISTSIIIERIIKKYNS